MVYKNISRVNDEKQNGKNFLYSSLNCYYIKEFIFNKI